MVEGSLADNVKKSTVFINSIIKDETVLNIFLFLLEVYAGF